MVSASVSDCIRFYHCEISLGDQDDSIMECKLINIELYKENSWKSQVGVEAKPQYYTQLVKNRVKKKLSIFDQLLRAGYFLTFYGQKKIKNFKKGDNQIWNMIKEGIENESFLNEFKFWEASESVLIFQFLNDKISNYVKQNLIVNTIIQK